MHATNTQTATKGFGSEPAPIQVFFSGARIEGTGQIVDLSLTGIEIAGAAPVPSPDAEMLVLFVSGEAAGTQAEVVVTRASGDRFAARFKTIEPTLQAAVSRWQGAGAT